ncbi:MAG: tRNA uridine-5-carboxymethylaminomethyl(34) synthesis GTPase MnmE [Bacteroidales bacterium]|nr:tRNA uridine-5-carboxymethylaminomethyl(34) synthesis GTPase MnmE [Bacteroidales bacterium]
MFRYDDTICAPATSVGAGAISIIRMSGTDALRITDEVVRFSSGTALGSKGYTLKFGRIPDVDEVLVSIFRAPHSYTGEDSVEISCHASSFVVSRILELIIVAGARSAEPGEFTRRAFVNGKMDLAQAEAVADLISAGSEAAHRVAVNQLRGKYSLELRGLRDELLHLATLLELELDFSEEDVEFADRSRLRALLDEVSAHVARLCDSFRTGNAIKKGVPVAIVGAVNSGKSTLLNALLGEDRAIVSDIPGTTRDTVEEVMVLDGVQFRFIDTAGIREASDSVEKIGIERSLKSLSQAEVVLGVLDGCASPEEAGKAAAQISSRISPAQTLIMLFNKADLVPEVPAGFPACDLKISARTGEGLEELKRRIASSYTVASASADATLVTNLRHYEALSRARENLAFVSKGLDLGTPSDLLAEDLRAAIRELGSIFGEIAPDEVLGRIFANFCIGK